MFIRKLLQENNVRGLYKVLNLNIPKATKETMLKNGAAFFDKMSLAKSNKFEVKTIHS